MREITLDNLSIVEVNYGIGSVYEDCIELNHKLPTELRDRILKHEENHSKVNSYTKEDFMLDFQSKSSYFKESFLFSLRNLEALIGFFPLMYSYYKKIWTWNTGALVPYLWFGLIFSLFFSLIFKVNFFLALLGYTIMFVSFNIVLIILTHSIVKKDKGFIYKILED